MPNSTLIYKVQDALRGSGAAEYRFAALDELARLGRVIEHLEHSTLDAAPLRLGKIFEKKLNQLVNDRELNREWGFGGFSELPTEFMVKLAVEISEIGTNALRDALATELETGSTYPMGGPYTFPANLFAAVAPYKQFKAKDHVLVSDLGRGFAVIRELLRACPGLRITAPLRERVRHGLYSFVLGRNTSVLIEQDGYRDVLDSQKYSYVLVFPAFGERVSNPVCLQFLQERGLPTSVTSVETDIAFALDRMAGSSAVVTAMVPEGFMFSRTSRPFRDWILNSANLESIVQLPPKALAPYTNIKTNLIRFSCEAAATAPIKVTQLDVSAKLRRQEKHEKSDPKATSLDIERAKFKELETWSLNQFFSPASCEYVITGKTIPLRELVIDVFRGAPTTAAEEDNTAVQDIRLVEPKDLINDTLEVDKLEKRSVSSTRPLKRYELVDGDILLVCRGSAIRVSVAKGVGKQAIIPSANLAVIRPNTAVVVPEFLANFLRTPVGQSGLLARQSGSTMLVLSVKDLSTVEVPLLALEQQQELVNQNEKLERWRNEEESRVREKYEAETRRLYKQMNIDFSPELSRQRAQ